MNNTVTDTMTVDLTKERINNTVDTVKCVRKKVGCHSKRTSTKSILLGKRDKLDVNVGDYVYVLTEDEFNRLNKNEVCEEKSWWKKIIQR